MEGVRVEVKIELGHKASCKKTPSPEGFTHDWVVFVRGPESCDISHFVEKVVFYLHESFAKPKRVLKDPPYTVAEAGYGSFFLPVEVFFKNKEEPRKLMFDYDLVLPACGSPPIDNIRSEALTFTNPTEEFRKKLVRGGGIVTSTGTVNGFHSSSLPVNGSAVQQSTDSRDGKMTKIITDSHPTLQLSTSATTESDKNKKGKHEAVVANKTVKMQESVTPGLKRSSSTSGVEDTQPVKKKKKKPDEASGKPNKPLGFIPLELPVAGNEHKEKLDEMKDVKLKIKSLSSKSPANDKKKNRRVSSEVGSGENVSNTSKRRESTSSKKSKKNSPKDDFKQQAKQEEKKVEKITFRRRGSGDSWSSSTSSSSLLGNSGGNKNMALDKLIAEMSEEDDDDDANEVDVCTPFQSKSLQPSVTTQKPIADAVSSPNSTLQTKDSSNKGRTKSSSQVKKSEAVKNKRKNGLKSPKSLKQSPKPKLKDSTQASNGQRNSSSENLIQLYKRLVALKDSNLLQRIADILETTGRFELTETTLDFDLCSLDKTTIKKIESSINR